MSEMYEAVIVCGDPATVRDAVEGLSKKLSFRLVPLGGSLFGVHRIAGRHDPFDPIAMEAVARQMAKRLGKALAVVHDNQCGIRASVLFSPSGATEFGEADELWYPLGEDGDPVISGPALRVHELAPVREYECVSSAIDIGLNALGVEGSAASAGLLKQYFCYDADGSYFDK